jgi:hypothetical protein
MLSAARFWSTFAVFSVWVLFRQAARLRAATARSR